MMPKGHKILALAVLASVGGAANAEEACVGPPAINMKNIAGGGKWQERPFRLPDVDPSTYTPEQKEAAHRMFCELGVKQIAGPHRAYMRDTRVFNAMTELIKAENNTRVLDKRLVRLIALTYSRQWKAQFEWFVQAPIAVRDGVSPDVVEAIRTGKQPKFTREDERLVYLAINEMDKNKALSDGTFNQLHKILGDDGFTEFLTTCGTFMVVGMQVKALEIRAPAPFTADPIP